ncbi:MAG: hypothetical protein J6Y26_02745 [Lachnospiraceae bacterium]|nr:hypothetical protein [Lachnospiraceae bacterium]
MAVTVKLYKVTDDERVVSKTLGTAKEYSCTLKNEQEILAPEVSIQTSDNLSDYNYMYIERYGRYYYAKISTTPNGFWRIKGRVDVLMSHKTELLALSGTLERSEKNYNGYLNDPEFKAVAYRKIVTKQFPNAIDNDCFILMTVG